MTHTLHELAYMSVITEKEDYLEENRLVDIWGNL